MVPLTPGSQSPVRKRRRGRILDEERIAALESREKTRREPSLSPRRVQLDHEESINGGQCGREAVGDAGGAREGEGGGLDGERSEGFERDAVASGLQDEPVGQLGQDGRMGPGERGVQAEPASRGTPSLRRTTTDSTLTSSDSEPVVLNKRTEAMQASTKRLGPVPDPLMVARALSPHAKGKKRTRSEEDLPTSMEQMLEILPKTRTTIKSKRLGKKRDLRVDPFASPLPSPRPRQPAPRASALFRQAQCDSDREELSHNYLGAADLAGMSSKAKTRYVERAAGAYLRSLVIESEEASEYEPSEDERGVKKKTKNRKSAKQDAGHGDVKRLKKGEAAKGDFIRRAEQTAFAPLLARQTTRAPKAVGRRAKPLARQNTVSGLGEQVSRATGLRIKRSMRGNQEKKPAKRRQTLDARRRPLEFGFEEEAGDVAPTGSHDPPTHPTLTSKAVHSRSKNRSVAVPPFRHRFEPARLPPPMPFASIQLAVINAPQELTPLVLQQRSRQVEKVDPPAHPAPVPKATAPQLCTSRFRFDRGPKAHKALTLDAEKWYAAWAEEQAQDENFSPLVARTPSLDAQTVGGEAFKRGRVDERGEQEIASAKKQRILRRLPTVPDFTFIASFEQTEDPGEDIAGSRAEAPQKEDDTGHHSSREFQGDTSAHAARVHNAGPGPEQSGRRAPTVLVPPTPPVAGPLPCSSFASFPLPTPGCARLCLPSSSATFDVPIRADDKSSSSPPSTAAGPFGDGSPADHLMLSDSPLLSRIPSAESDSSLPSRSMPQTRGRRKVGRRLLSSSPSRAPPLSREPTSQLEADELVEQPPSDAFYLAGTETLEAAAAALAVTDEQDDFGTISLRSGDDLLDLHSSRSFTAMARQAVDDKRAQVTQQRNDSILNDAEEEKVALSRRRSPRIAS